MSAMTASERRQQIARLLSASQAPISATTLSQELGVSRQIIVGDIALLRAAGQEITATARGYVIPAQNGLLRRIACIHSAEETRDELDAMVDCGCTVVDVIVEHPVYGQLTAPLHLSSRLDVDQFMKRCGRAAASQTAWCSQFKRQKYTFLRKNMTAAAINFPGSALFRRRTGTRIS